MEDFNPWWDEQATKKTGGNATRRYVALGTGFAPDCPGLSGREKHGMYETHKSREARRK